MVGNVSKYSLKMRITDARNVEWLEIWKFSTWRRMHDERLFILEERPRAVISNHRIISSPAIESLQKEDNSLQIQIDLY